MIPWTTPTIGLKIPNVDFTQADEIKVTLKQGNLVLTKTGADVTPTQTGVSVTLTERESAAFQSNKNVVAQVNWTYTTTDGMRRAATNPMGIHVGVQLLNEEMIPNE